MTSYKPDIEAGKRVLELEAQGLTQLAAGLDENFGKAIDVILGVKGRLIVSGMGKSGHVGKKIAATFASTGTPAFFVHPGEASHGDLGMIGREDGLMILSNSGETAELGDLIAHAKRWDVPLIGIASNPTSKLLSAATVGLLLADAPEACPNGLAPTTSTTQQLALGDALAVALMARRGFSADDFRTFHPGGSLGAKLMPVQEIMHKGDALPLVTEATPMRDALVTITSKSFGCAGVLNQDGALTGVITDGDLRRHLEQGASSDPLGATAADFMSAAPKTIAQSALVAEAAGVMNRARITALFVVDDAAAADAPPKPIGLIHLHDCLRAGFA
ncbi:MAG: KpsF/GutQ family sugar-phosphate isomerase [Alphaproteobacteria bacterium]